MSYEGRVVDMRERPFVGGWEATIQAANGQLKVVILENDSFDAEGARRKAMSILFLRAFHFGLLVWGDDNPSRIVLSATLAMVAQDPRPAIVGSVKGIVVGIQVNQAGDGCVWIGENGNPFAARLLQLRPGLDGRREAERTRIMIDLLSAAGSTGEIVSLSYGSGQLVDLSTIRIIAPPSTLADERYAPRIHDHFYALPDHRHDKLYRPRFDFTIDDAHNDERYRPRTNFTIDDTHNGPLYRDRYTYTEDEAHNDPRYRQRYVYTEDDAHNDTVYVRQDTSLLFTMAPRNFNVPAAGRINVTVASLGLPAGTPLLVTASAWTGTATSITLLLMASPGPLIGTGWGIRIYDPSGTFVGGSCWVGLVVRLDP